MLSFETKRDNRGVEFCERNCAFSIVFYKHAQQNLSDLMIKGSCLTILREKLNISFKRLKKQGYFLVNENQCC